MKEWKYDNRWPTGSLGGFVPDNARAAYGARWIDHGTGRPDIVPDRQGCAWDDEADKDRLLNMLAVHDPVKFATGIVRDEIVRDEIVEIDHTQDSFYVLMRRSGGYFYVAAWIT